MGSGMVRDKVGCGTEGSVEIAFGLKDGASTRSTTRGSVAETGIWCGIGCPCPIGSSGSTLESIEGSATEATAVSKTVGASFVDSMGSCISGVGGTNGKTTPASGMNSKLAGSTTCSMTGPTADSGRGSASGSGSTATSAAGGTKGSGTPAVRVEFPANTRADFPSARTPRRNEGSEAFNCNDTRGGPPMRRLLTAATRVWEDEISTSSTRGPVTGAAWRKTGTLIVRRRISGTITQANKKMPAKSKPPTSNLCRVSSMAGPDHSRTRAGARTVAGVATAIGAAGA